MRPDPVVVIAPPACDAPDLLEAVEDFAIEQFVAQGGIEAFDIAILPWAAGLDIEGRDAEPPEPVAHRMGDELGTVVGPDMLRWPMFDEQIGEDINDIVRPEPPQGLPSLAAVGSSRSFKRGIGGFHCLLLRAPPSPVPRHRGRASFSALPED